MTLGVDSDCEYLDIDLTEPIEAEDLAGRLNQQLPDGLVILAAQEVPPRSPSIEASILAFRYHIDLDPQLDSADVDERLRAFLAATEFRIHKHARGGDRSVDARSYVSALARRDVHQLEAEILFGPRGTIKPGDLMTAILGLERSDASRLRVHKVDTVFRRPAMERPGQTSAAAI